MPSKLNVLKPRAVLILIGFILLGKTSFAQSSISTRLDKIFEKYSDSGFSGSVLVSEKNKVSLKKGYGYADNQTKKKNTPQTLFNVASIGKHFTVYAILLLEARGLLSTGDHLSKYVGMFNDARDSVTIHHLLIHSSGLFKDGAPIDYSGRTNFIRSVKELGPESAAGEKHRYSNTGYMMLATVVEIVSGEPFENFLLKIIFQPLGMKNTGYPWEARMNKKLFATGYNSKREAVPPQADVWAARGPGNLVTNVEDLYKWMQAFQNKKLVPVEIKNKILVDYLPGKDTYSWTKEVTSRKTRFYNKGGGRSDFENRLMWYPDDEVIIMFLINNDYNLARKIYNEIKAVMN